MQVVREGARRGAGALPAVSPSPRAFWRTIPGRGGPIRLRILPPASGPIERIYFRIHGGGWCLGSADTAKLQLEQIAEEANALVVSVEYRLAPEHPFPAGCEDAACWLVMHASSEFGTENIVIGEDSAGAHLSILTMLRMRDRHHYSGFKGANLICGCYDLSGTPSMRSWGNELLVLDTPTCQWFFDQFVPNFKDRANPEISPLYADLTRLPPALFTVGTMDPTMDDTLFMAQRWRTAGNSAEIAIYPGGVHAFDVFPLSIAAAATQRYAEFIARC